MNDPPDFDAFESCTVFNAHSNIHWELCEEHRQTNELHLKKSTYDDRGNNNCDRCSFHIELHSKNWMTLFKQ